MALIHTGGIKGNLSRPEMVRNGSGNVALSGLEHFENKTLMEFSLFPTFNFFKFEPYEKTADRPCGFFWGKMKLDKGLKGQLSWEAITFGSDFKHSVKRNGTFDSRKAYQNTADLYGDEFANQDSSGSFFVNDDATDSHTKSFQRGLTYSFSIRMSR